jgi:hypothetical protein
VDGAAVADPAQPLTASTLFLRDGMLVRLVDLRGTARHKLADPAMDVEPGELGLLLDPGHDLDLTTGEGLRNLLASCAMDLITDRGSAGE